MSIRKILLVALAIIWMMSVALVAAQETITLRFSTWDTGEGAERDQAVIDAFMEANPNIEVIFEAQDGAEDPAILVQMAAGTAPDVIMAGEFNLKRRALASEGGFLNMNDLIEADMDFDPNELYFPEVYSVGVIDGGSYAFNKDFATTTFYVNTDMFEEAGLDLPEEGWTYDDMIAIGQELTLDANGNNALSPDFDPDNIVQYGWWHAHDWVRGWQPIPYSFGGQLLSDDGLTATGFLNSEEVAAAIALYRDGVHEYHIAPSISAIEAQEGVDLFGTGQVAMRGPYGPWALTGYSENPDLSFAVVPMPEGPAGRFSVICWAGFAVNRHTEHPEEAYALAKWFATEGQNVFAEHALSANIEVSEAIGYADDALWGQFVREIPNLHPLDDLKTAHWVECINAPVSNLLAAVQGEDGASMDIQAELDSLAADADECLAQDF